MLRHRAADDIIKDVLRAIEPYRQLKPIPDIPQCHQDRYRQLHRQLRQQQQQQQQRRRKRPIVQADDDEDDDDDQVASD